MNKNEIFISYYLYSEYMFFYTVKSIQKQYTKITSLPDITYILHRVRDVIVVPTSPVLSSSEKSLQGMAKSCETESRVLRLAL